MQPSTDPYLARSESVEVPGTSTLIGTWIRRMLPWVGSAVLLTWILMHRDLAEVGDALSMAAWLPLVMMWALYATGTVFCETVFLWALLGSTGRHAPVRDVLAIRSFTYMLSAFHSAFSIGCLIVWIQKRFKTRLASASGLMGLEIIFEIGTLGLLGLIGARICGWTTLANTPELDALETFGWLALGASVAIIGWHRWRGDWQIPLPGIGVLAGIKLIQNLIHGGYVVALLWCFALPVNLWEGMGMAQIVRSIRGLPLSVMGVGVDQVAFETLIQSIDVDRLLACSLIYTASMLAARVIPGLISLPWATRSWAVTPGPKGCHGH